MAFTNGFDEQSVVNDKIRQLDAGFDLKKTNFTRFSDLAKLAEESGHITLGRDKETLHIESSKHYDENAPLPVCHDCCMRTIARV